MFSPNYAFGHTAPPRAICLHTMGGSLKSCDSTFRNAAPGGISSRAVSAHYGIGLRGELHQYVALENSAYGNGVLEKDNRWPLLWCTWSNGCTISIETEDSGLSSTVVTDLQYAGVLTVARLALDKYPSITHLIKHADISPQSRPNCPGPRWVDSGRYADLARDLGLEVL